ncbi:translocation/assembly module TamB [Marinobacter halodurans]|uniref:Translocation/assembly module TamB n=1 Tax=Marinobacter halodurans TaxID=2528979 RepID=A0ABY1ZQR5_9GAMM|nr:translocation/assembly module TamB domain-containing protein [Marinobacter halodurans]TBW59464.1 translocation/assembly module TamB [Marinobacter halodurans]
MKRVLWWTAGSLLALVFLLLFTVFLVLRSDAGTAWLLEQVPGLDVSGGKGAILGRWQASHVRWQGYGVNLDLDQVFLEWSPSCLFTGVLCVDRLLAERIDVHLAPGESSSDEPVTLPSINLPVGLSVGDVRLGPLSVDDSTIWRSFTLSVDASGAAWTIQDFGLVTDAVEVNAKGRLETRGDWPLDLDVAAELPSPEPDGDWSLALDLTGSARDLQLKGTSHGYLPAHLSGRVRPFEPGVPATLKLNSDRFMPWSGLPATLELNQWKLALVGNLDDGFDVTSTATLPGTEGPVSVRLTGNALTDRARNIDLQLALPDAPKRQARLTGEVQWLDAFSARGKLAIDQFPWYTLLPGVDEPPVKLQSAEATFNYADDRYQVHLQAAANGPAGDMTLSTEADGDLQQVTLSNLRLDTGAGGLAGKTQVRYGDVVSWDADLNLDRFNPGFWVADLNGQLSGSVTTAGSMPETGLQARADWQLDGTWRRSALSTLGHLEGNNGSWTVDPLRLKVGDNTVTGRGQWGDRIETDVRLALPNLAQLWPGLAGRIDGTVHVSGSPRAPSGTVTLKGRQLGWQDLELATLDLNGSLKEGKQVDAGLTIDKLHMGEQVIGDLDARLQGTADRHRLTLDLTHPEATVKTVFEGSLGQLWSGALTQASVATSDQTWRLDQPASIDYTDKGRLRLGAHCWRWQSSSLCADDQVLLPDQSIHYQLQDFPMDSLAALWPDDFRWQAKMNGEIDLTMTDKGPDGAIHLDAGPGAFGIRQQGEWRSIDYRTLKLAVNLKPRNADVTLDLGGEQLGSFKLDLSVDPTSRNREIQGHYALSGLQLAIIEPFAGLQSIGGQIEGEGDLSGPLFDPRVNGNLSLLNGKVLDPSIPIPFRDVSLDIAFKGQRAEVDGSWHSNERSKGSVDGDINWRSGKPSVTLNLKGDRLPLVYEPYARLELSPDIQFSFKDRKVSVSGRVDVPRGEIEVRELPPSAVSVSEDEVIVGQEKQQPGVQEIAMDVTVVVGEDKVSFKGFGVSGNLKGELHIGNNLDTRGTLQLVDGTYKAYGQELEIRRARLVFVGPVSEPYIDVEAVRTVDNVVAGVRLSGPADEPEAEVFSEPPMPQAEALSYVILGRPLRSSGDQSQVGQAALSLGLAQTHELTRGLGEEFGIRDLTLEAEGSGEEASVVASGYITDDLSVRYGVGVFEPITTVALRYDLGRYFYLEAASGLAASLDLFYTRDF